MEVRPVDLVGGQLSLGQGVWTESGGSAPQGFGDGLRRSPSAYQLVVERLGAVGGPSRFVGNVVRLGAGRKVLASSDGAPAIRRGWP